MREKNQAAVDLINLRWKKKPPTEADRQRLKEISKLGVATRRLNRAKRLAGIKPNVL